MATPASTPSGAQLSKRELSAWRGMLRAYTALTKALDAQLEAEHGLPLSSYEVLMHIADAPEQRMRMSELAESVLLSRSGLTRMVDRLERDGLLCREACSCDARGAFAKLTAAGERRLAAARATHLAGVRELFLERLDEVEQGLLGEIWQRVLSGTPTGAPGAGTP
jgi:DNA-binding MarR family transcriptional regulator